MYGKELVEARFQWAEEHLETLKTEYASYFHRKPYRLKVQPNREYTEYTFRIKITEAIPEHWPFVISDIVHNLRSTLDNLAFNLAGKPAGRRGENIQFPIVHPGRKGGRPAFDRSAPARLAGIHPDAVTIIESVQPYHGLRGVRPPYRSPGPWPPYPLSVLNYMSNIDKHRTPHVGFVAVTDVAIASSVRPIEFVTFTGRLLEDNAVIARCKFPRTVKPNVDVSRPSAGLVLALEVPWGRRSHKVVTFDYLDFMKGLVEKDILVPLRRYMK